MTISRQQLQLINRKRLRYPLDIAEKDYHRGNTGQLADRAPGARGRHAFDLLRAPDQ
jgi:hypothetical protein